MTWNCRRLASVGGGLRLQHALIACVAAVCSSGCTKTSNPAAPSMGAVAVIDLDVVAQSLGSDKQIAQSINVRQSTLNEQLTKLAKSYQEQLAKHQTGASEQAPVTGEVTLANWQQQANATLTKAKRQVQSDLAQHRAQLVAQFREQIKPFAREAARARGLSIIVTRNDSVIYDFSESVDITAAVVESIRKQNQATPPARVASAPDAQGTTTTR